jgi:hypothetical protein
MPRTYPGKLAGVLAAVFLVVFAAFIKLAQQRRGGPELNILGIVALVSGIAAFITGIISLIKFKDRSFVVILATVIGSLATLIFVGELAEGIAWRLTH